MKNLLSALLVVSLCFAFSSCEKEVLTPQTEQTEDKINFRTGDPGGRCQPGSFDIRQDRLRFADDLEFETMINFLSCASPAEKAAFRNSIPVETSQKSYLEFRELSAYGNINTAQELLDLEATFDGRITVHIAEGTNERSYSASLNFFEEIATNDGLFMVGDDYLKVVEDKLYRLKNGTEQDALAINKDTPPTPEGGLGPDDPVITVDDVVITTRSDDNPVCCPYSDKFEKVYNSGQNKLQMEYKTLDFSTYSGSVVSLSIVLDLKASHDRRKSLGFFSYWACDPAALGMGYTIELEYQPKGAIYSFSQDFSSLGYDGSCTFPQPSINVCQDVHDDAPPFDFRNHICYNEINVYATNEDNGETVSGDCGEPTNEDELNPKIVFYKYSGAYGDPMCTIPLEPSVGHINFTQTDLCENDEARSATLHEIPAGTVMRIFDNSEGSTNDDFVVITVHRDLIYHVVSTFESEEDFVSDDLTIEFCCGGNLNGKVSSFRDF